MKLVKQTTLSFQEGRSDKVYEVDLCEVAQGSYVVNFRYGRRGAALKSGSKTTNPLSLADAEKIFNGLVAEKVKKGYQDTASHAATAPRTAKRKITGQDEGARRQAILKRLADAEAAGGSTGSTKRSKKPGSRVSSADQSKGSWDLDRVIWRAGELKIKEAAPLLINLLGTGTALRDYCIVWSLGFCGDEQTIDTLSRLYAGAQTPDMVRRIACEALLKLSDEKTSADSRDELINSLPQELSYLARQGSPEEFAKALATYLDNGDHTNFEVLETLYLIDNQTVRPALLNLLHEAPIRPPYFQRIRHIFKAAEYRRDAEVYGIIAYRFEKSRAMFTSSYWSGGLDKDKRHLTWVYVNDGTTPSQYIQDGRKEIQSPTSKIGYSSRTRIYLRDRVWRTLRRMGEVGDLDYIKMAVGVLLPFTDGDAQTVRENLSFDARIRDFKPVYWDAFAGYWAFNHILYKNSPRYILRRNSRAWRCKPSYKPGAPAPKMREEAFPRLWEQKPEGLLHLIAECNCRPVIEFAARALASLEDFCAQLDIDTILMILDRPYEEAAQLGFKLAQMHHNALSPNRTLTLALLNCRLEEARKEAQSWVSKARDQFLKDGEFLTGIVFSPYADTRGFARNLLLSAAFREDNAKAVTATFIEQLKTLDASQTEIARDVVETILKCFAPQLRTLEMSVLNSLLAHPLLEAQELGGQLLLNHNTPAKDLPSETIQSLIASPYESMRGIGIKLFGQLDDETLSGHDKVIAAFAMHELEDVRQAIRPVIRRLCQIPETDRKLGLKLAGHFLEALTAKQGQAEMHSTLVKIMREDIGVQWMEQATRGTAWKLVQSKSQPAQELGGVLLQFKTNTDDSFTEDFDFTDLVELSNHEVLALREASRLMFSKMLNRLQAVTNPSGHHEEMTRAVKLLDAKWDDSRDFWFLAFDSHFGAEDFTPGILVAICDSVRPDVQTFGCKLITRFFADKDGQEYLLKLSEHPSAELQSFATNYLERYAVDNPARLAELKYYFVSVLSRVNRARLAKDRVLKFLTREAQKSEAAALLVAEILTRQSATMAIGDKAATIEAMLTIHRAFPQIAMPLTVREPEVRNAF